MVQRASPERPGPWRVTPYLHPRCPLLGCGCSLRTRATSPPQSSCTLTLALPWKLKVSTYSPGRVSLWRITKRPWLREPPASTSCAALTLDSVPWNQG